MPEKLIGTVSHYYGKIGVAVIELKGTLKVGDKIQIRRNEEVFDQEVKSMQIEHKNIKEAKKGQSIGMKTDQPAKEGAEVYKID